MNKNYYLKLTKNQNNCLEGLYNFQVKNHWKNYEVSDLYVYMTCINSYVKENWFDRTFESLIELGIIEKIEYTTRQKGGFYDGKKYNTYMYDFTNKGLAYMGITEDDIIY